MPLSDVRQQALSDLLEAERRLRAHAEDEIRALRGLLYSLARTLDGDRVEQIRRETPSAFRTWDAERYQSFFAPLVAKRQWAKVSTNGNGWHGNNGNGHGCEKLKAKVARLQAENRRLKEQLEESRKHAADLANQLRDVHQFGPSTRQEAPTPALSKAAPSTTPQEEPSSAQANKASILEALAEIRRQPPRVPARVEHLFDAAVIARTRQIMALYILAVYGLAVRLEVDYYIAQAEGIKPRSGAIRRRLDKMAETGLVVSKKLSLKAPRTSLIVLRLSEEGRRIAKQMFQRPPVENEWERLERLHEGKRFPGHTAAVLMFAMHARLRGYTVTVLPEVKSPSPPDVLIEWQERLYVEVELGRKERLAKWKHNAALNEGKAALVAGTASRREVLRADIQRMGLPGKATDLEYLLRAQPDAPLWVDEW